MWSRPIRLRAMTLWAGLAAAVAAVVAAAAFARWGESIQLGVPGLPVEAWACRDGLSSTYGVRVHRHPRWGCGAQAGPQLKWFTDHVTHGWAGLRLTEHSLETPLGGTAADETVSDDLAVLLPRAVTLPAMAAAACAGGLAWSSRRRPPGHCPECGAVPQT